MKSIFTLTLIFIKMRLREPLEVIWNIALPCLVFLGLMVSWDFRLDSDGKLITYTSILSWVLLQWAVSGVGIYLVEWRESGLTKSLVQGWISRKRILYALMATQWILFIPFLIFSVVSLGYFGEDLTIAQIGWIHLRSFLLLSLLSFASVILNTLSYSSGNMNTLVSMCFLPLTLLASSNSPKWAALNFLNPIWIGGDFIKGGISHTSASACFGFVGLAVFSGLIGMKKFRTVSSVRRSS